MKRSNTKIKDKRKKKKKKIRSSINLGKIFDKHIRSEFEDKDVESTTKAMDPREILKIEGVEDYRCIPCGSKLQGANGGHYNYNEKCEELPRFIYSECGMIYEQTTDDIIDGENIVEEEEEDYKDKEL